jgi:protein archease
MGEIGKGAGPVGHRTVPHTADLRIEAWAPTIEQCAAEAARALVESFAELPAAAPAVVREYPVQAADTGDAEERVVAVLEEVIFRLDSAGELPRELAVRRTSDGLLMRCAMVDVSRATVIGAAPKAVSLHELCVTEGVGGCRCVVTLDV